jgi:hypothetical protein
LVDKKLFGIKALITPGASPLLVFNMFRFGLIECLYLSKNLEEINMLPGPIKMQFNYTKTILPEKELFT